MATIPFASLFPMVLLALGASMDASLTAQSPEQNPVESGPGPDRPQEKEPKQTPLPTSVTIGDALPESLVLQDFAGKAVDLGKLRGKVIVLHFWSVSCPSEKVAEPKINQLALDFDETEVVVLGVAANQNEIGKKPEAEAFAAEKPEDRPYARLRSKCDEVGMNHPVLADHGAVLGKMLKARTTPHCFVFDKKGVLVYSGALDDNGRGKAQRHYVKDAIQAAMKGDKVMESVTMPYG